MGNLCDTICDCADSCEDEDPDKCSNYYQIINGMTINMRLF